MPVEDVPIIGSQHAHLLIFQVHHAFGVANERRRITGQEVLFLSEAQHQRAAQAGADHQLGMVRADHGDAVSALHQIQGDTHGFHQIAMKMTRDQLRQHFRIGVAFEDDAVGLELTFQGGIVLDDAVVHDGDGILTADVRVGIAVGRGPVGGPARVADAVAAGHRTCAQILHQIGNPPGALAQVQLRSGHRRQSGAVVPPILQAAKPFHQDGFRFPMPHVANNAAHARIPRLKIVRPTSPNSGPGGTP